jgi:hypothetical protein
MLSRCEKVFQWAIQYQNFSVILDDIEAEMFHEIGKWFDENNRPSLCKLEDGLVMMHGFVFVVRKGICLLELINNVIICVVVGGIFTHIKKFPFNKQGAESIFNSTSFAYSYTTITIRW